VEELFAEIDERPLAAASLAQVHRARTRAGQKVALKVQYPEARRLFPIDLRTLRFSARVVHWLNRKLDVRALADELAQFVALELDFARERASPEPIRQAIAASASPSVAGVVVPRVYPEQSSARVLTLDFVAGRPVSDVAGLAADGHALPALAERVANLYFW